MNDYWKGRDFSIFYKTLKSSLKELKWLANGRSSTSTYWVRSSQVAEEVELLITQPVKQCDMEPVDHVGFAIDARCSLWGAEVALNNALAGSPFAGGASPMLLRGAELITSCPTYLQTVVCLPVDRSEDQLCGLLMGLICNEIMPTWVEIFDSMRPMYLQLRAAGVCDYVYMMEAIGSCLARGASMSDEDAALLDKLCNRQPSEHVHQSHLKSLSMKAETMLLEQIRWLATKLPSH